MSTVKNHYVPRLLLRKFNEKISTYNLKTNELKFNQKQEKVFVVKNLYSNEIEKLFNEKLESEFAVILKNKILITDTDCTFNRLELGVIKKFLLISMFRTADSEKFMQHNLEQTRKTAKEALNFEEKGAESLSSFDYWMRTLKCVLESSLLEDVINHPEATAKAVCWAYTFNVGYISIWDSTKTKEEFVIMDQGMTSEHEITRFLEPINRDSIKVGYLCEMLKKSHTDSFSFVYLRILKSNNFMSENMYLFTISKNRMIAIINPFFVLYDEKAFENTVSPPKPDIWPTSLQNRNLFFKNRNEYLDEDGAKDGKYSAKDIFIYPVREMDLNDVLYVNCLILDRIQTMLGFSETVGIRRSLLTYTAINKKLNDYTGLIKKLNEFGYETAITEKYFKIAEAFNDLIQFTNSEIKYISNYLELMNLEKNLRMSAKK